MVKQLEISHYFISYNLPSCGRHVHFPYQKHFQLLQQQIDQWAQDLQFDKTWLA